MPKPDRPSNAALNLMRVAASAPSADNSQPWRGRTEHDGAGREHLAICAAHGESGATPFGPASHATLVAVGSLFENLASVALRLDTAPPTLAPEFRVGAPYIKCLVPTAQPLDGLLTRDILDRHTNRFPYERAAIDARVLDEIAGLRNASARLLLVTAKSTRDPLTEAFRESALVRFRTQSLHEWLFASLRFEPGEVARGDGLDIATLSLPPGGAQFMRFIRPWPRARWLNRLGLYKVMANAEVQTLRNAPALVAVVGARSEEGAIDAGRLMQRAWIRLNAAGVAVHPQYVIPDQINRLGEGLVPEACIEAVRSVAETVPSILSLATDEMLHMLLRIGIPRRTAPRSRRRSVGTMFDA